MEDIIIRRINNVDALVVSELISRNFIEVNIKDYSLDEMERLSEIYNPNKILEISGYAHMYVACLENTVIGCGAISSYRGKLDESILLTIFVLPELHNKGIGRMIVENLEKDEFFLRAKRIEIHASITAREFYIKLGYNYKDGNKNLDDEGHYIFEKFI